MKFVAAFLLGFVSAFSKNHLIRDELGVIKSLVQDFKYPQKDVIYSKILTRKQQLDAEILSNPEARHQMNDELQTLKNVVLSIDANNYDQALTLLQDRKDVLANQFFAEKHPITNSRTLSIAELISTQLNSLSDLIAALESSEISLLFNRIAMRKSELSKLLHDHPEFTSNIIDEATNLKNIEKSLQEPNVEKAMSFIRVRLDYLDHKQKSLNFDRKIQSEKKFILNQLGSFKQLVGDVNAKDSKAVFEKILARKQEISKILYTYPEYKTVMQDEFYALKEISASVQAQNFEQALSLIDSHVNMIGSKVEIQSDDQNLSVNNGSKYVLIATIVFLLAGFAVDSIAKQEKFVQKTPTQVQRQDQEDEFRSIKATKYYKQKATVVQFLDQA